MSTTTLTNSPTSFAHSPTTYTPPSTTVASSSTSTTVLVGPLTTSSNSTNSPSVSNNTSSSSQSLPLGPIIGGLVAALALLLLFIFLVLKHRSSQREIRSRPETNPQTVTPFGFNARERLSGYVSVNDDRWAQSTTARLSSPPISATTITPLTPTNHAFSPNAFPIPPRKLATRTTYAIHPPIQDEGIQLATIYTSNLNQGRFQSNLSNGIVINSPTREEGTSHTPNSSQTHSQQPLSVYISTDSNNAAPPAYDSIPSHIAHASSSPPVS